MLTTTRTISLLISTYNWPAALDLCLNSIRSQTLYPTEVIIADDGSKEETRALIDEFKKRFPGTYYSRMAGGYRVPACSDQE